jgi:hypothetical protein
VNCKYWIVLDWAGGPLKRDSEHKGWYEIESFSLDIATRGGPRSDGPLVFRLPWTVPR